MTHVLFSISGTIAKITNFSSENSTPHVQLSIPEERYAKGETTTVWHNVQVWGNMAENASKNLRPGSVVAIDIRIDYKKGADQSFTNFTAKNISYLSNFGSTKEGS